MKGLWIGLPLLAVTGGVAWLGQRIRHLEAWQALSRRDVARRIGVLEEENADLRERLAALEASLPPLVPDSLSTMTIGALLARRPDLGGLLIWLGLAPADLGPEARGLLLPEAGRRAGIAWSELRAVLTRQGPPGQSLQVLPAMPRRPESDQSR